MPWSSKGKAFKGVNLTERVLDVINVCWFAAKKANPSMPDDELASVLWCNASQSVHRLPFSYQAPVGTSSALFYHYGKDCVLTGFSHMRINGWSAHDLNFFAFSDAELKKLSGQAFSVPLATMLTILSYLNPWAPWGQ